MEWVEIRRCKVCGHEYDVHVDEEGIFGGGQCKCKRKNKISLDEALKNVERKIEQEIEQQRGKK